MDFSDLSPAPVAPWKPPTHLDELTTHRSDPKNTRNHTQPLSAACFGSFVSTHHAPPCERPGTRLTLLPISNPKRCQRRGRLSGGLLFKVGHPRGGGGSGRFVFGFFFFVNFFGVVGLHSIVLLIFTFFFISAGGCSRQHRIQGGWVAPPFLLCRCLVARGAAPPVKQKM